MRVYRIYSMGSNPTLSAIAKGPLNQISEPFVMLIHRFMEIKHVRIEKGFYW